MHLPDDWFARRRAPLLLLIAAATLYFAWQIPDLRLDTDVLNYLPDSNEQVRQFKESGQRFGSNYVVMVALEADDLFQPAPLAALRETVKAIELVRGVANVLALSNVLDMQKVGDGVEARPLLPDGPIPTEAKWLANLRRYVVGSPIYRGNLVSPDGKVALITVRLEEKADKQATAGEIKRAAAAKAGGYRLYFGGFSMIMEYMSSLIMREMSRLAPLVVLIVALTLFAGFGRWRGVAAPLGAVFVALIWTLGAMARLRMPLNMLSSAAPALLIATGASYGIYIVARFDEEAQRAGATAGSAALGAVRRLGWPIALTAATTVFGFVSLLSASLKIFGQFGIVMSMGAATAALLSLTLAPAGLSYADVGAPPRNRFAFLLDWPLRGAQWLTRGRCDWVLGVAGAMAAAALASVPHISRDVNLLSYFPKGSEPQVSERLLMEKFGGSQIFLVQFTAESVKHPAVLLEMQRLERRLRVMERVHYPQAATSAFRLVRSMMHEKPGLPDTVGGADGLWTLLQGQAGLDQLIDAEARHAVVMARIDSVDNGVLGRVVEATRELVTRTVPTELAFVELAKFDEGTRRALERAQAERVAADAALTLQHYDPTRRPDGAALAAALAETMAAPFRPSESDRGKIRERLDQYFRSEESDLQLDSPAAGATIAAALAALEQFDDASIKATLRRTVPAKVQADDPQGVDYATGTIRLRVKDLADEKRLAAARAAAGRAAGLDLADPAQRALSDDLDADLAGVNNSFVSLPAAQFKKLAKRAPAGKESVKLGASLTGWPPLSVMLDRELISTMAASILLAVAVIIALLAAQLRSLLGGLLAATPICFTILLTFGVMSLARVPLDNSTMMIASIAMGIGVGYTIQFVARLKWELRDGREAQEALAATVGTAGRAILINSLAVGAGFLALVFSSMTPQKRFGSLIALTMLLAAAGALTVLPAIFAKWRPASLRAAGGRNH